MSEGKRSIWAVFIKLLVLLFGLFLLVSAFMPGQFATTVVGFLSHFVTVGGFFIGLINKYGYSSVAGCIGALIIILCVWFG